MNYNSLFDNGYATSQTYTGAFVWLIISAIVALIGGITLYFTVFSKKNEGKYKGFLEWLYDFATFKKLLLETILKALYIVTAIYITLSSVALISTSFLSFVTTLIFGNILARVVYEFLLLIITICRNTTEINQKLSKPKSTKKEE